jgi:hypothetical protein
MDVFKLRVVVGDAQIELEGEGSLVHAIFQELRDNGIGKLATLQSPSGKNDEIVASRETNSKVVSIGAGQSSTEPPSSELPALNNVVLSGSPSTEAEWILIYAAYCSNQGSKTFTKEDLRDKYEETRRATPARSKNFVANLKSLIASKYISAINDTEFRMEKAGLEVAENIVRGDIKNTRSKTSQPQKKRMPVSYKIIDIGLSDDQRKSLKGFWDSHSHSTNIDKAVLTAYFAKKEKNIEAFSADLFFTILRNLGELTSFDLGSSIINAKNKKSYFDAEENAGEFRLNHIGEDHVTTLLSTSQQ